MRFILVLLAATLATPVLAQEVSPLTGTTGTTTATDAAPARHARGHAHHPRVKMQQRFDAANTSKDGKLTLNQAKAANMKRVADNFDAIDASKKGYVTMEDIRAYNHAQRAARHAAKAQKQPPA